MNNCLIVRENTMSLRCWLQKPPTPDSPEVKEYKAVVDTVIDLLNTEAELIETGRAPNGSATNVNLIIHDLLPSLAQQRLQPTTNRHQLLEEKQELCLLADLLKGTQKEYNVVDKSLSDLEEEDEVCSLKLLHTCTKACTVQLSYTCRPTCLQICISLCVKPPADYAAARLQSWMCKPVQVSRAFASQLRCSKSVIYFLSRWHA